MKNLTLKKIRLFTDELGKILARPYEFCGLSICVNYCKRAKHSPSWNIEAHYHPWYEFNYVAKGSVYTTVNQKEFLIRAGESYLISPGGIHSPRHNKTGDDGICIRFSLGGDDEGDVMRVLGAPHPYPFVSDVEKLNVSGGVRYTQASFAAWLMHLYDLKSRRTALPPAPENTFAAQVILYLTEYHMKKIRVAEVANALNTSVRTLSRKFLAQTGMTVTEKLTSIRIEHAKRLLISTECSMYEIAEQCGFENEFYFSKIFRQKENITPSRYRKQYTPTD